MIKAAFFDIDGTLLSFKTHRVSEGTIRAFERLHKAGIRTFLSTGRPQVLIPPMPVKFDATITMNGGYVFTPTEVLYANPIPQEDTDAWLDYSQRHAICTMLFTADAMMAANPTPVGYALRDMLEFPMPPIVDVSAMRGKKAYQLIAVMPQERDEEVGAMMTSCHLPRWHEAFTDIVAAGNNKAVGMEAICRHYGISQEETLAFGDGGNDTEMLQWAGIGVAMGNASEELKRVADWVTSSVDEEGIERAVERLLEVV